MVRSTHGANCTGSCSWMVYVKDGLITWEMQAFDYPLLEHGLPPYEPRGCQRGISASWYIYSPIRVRYPYIRGALMDLWREARSRNSDPVEAWRSIVENPQSRTRYQQARGKGGFRRSSWDEALEIIGAAVIHTIKKWGSDRILGFSPIPAMSQVSYAAGYRFLQLIGGFGVSFYDWYCDLPPAEPEVWGDQTDTSESADWYNAKFLVSYGANLNMTRTPCVHFAAEAKHAGTKFVVLAPDFSMVAKYSDWWIPVKAGTDNAFWNGVTHVLLKEFWVDRQVPYFVNYVKQYTDSPFLVKLEKTNNGYEPSRLLTAAELAEYKDLENADFKFLAVDGKTGKIVPPMGTIGYRWAKSEADQGKWNLNLKNGVDSSEIDPVLTLIDKNDGVIDVNIREYGNNAVYKRGVPVLNVDTTDGKVAVTTVFDLLMAHYGVPRGLSGDYPRNYDDDKGYTPAWQEKFTGIGRSTVIRFAREWGITAEKTNGKCMVIVGAAINHWYHNNLNYRSAMAALMVTGCVGRNGGGLNHYVGQEKLAAQASWVPIAMARDWVGPPRLQQGPIWHYVNSDQWRYDSGYADYDSLPGLRPDLTKGHTIDHIIRAVRLGWMPFYPQFNKPNPEIVKDAVNAGAKTDEEIIKHVVGQLKDRKLRFAVEDPDAPENWPRVWFIWRGNAMMSSAKGHEFFLKHYLGTHTNTIAEELAKGKTSDVEWRNEAPRGKMDLVVDLNFRMDTTALYSDIVLPAAHWYEKADLNSTDLHSYYNVLGQAVPPAWEARNDWEIFKAFAKKVSELAVTHLPKPVRDLHYSPLSHDTVDELAQRTVKDWSKGECEPIPGKTMGKLSLNERDYTQIYNKYISFGPLVKKTGLGAHGASFSCEDDYEEWKVVAPTVEWGGEKYPSFNDPIDVCNAILRFAPESDGEINYKAWKNHEKKTGLELAEKLGGPTRSVRYTYWDAQAQLRRLLTTPCWTGDTLNGRAYAPFCIQIDHKVPFRTLTGRQHFYIDHEMYIAWGEMMPTFKPKPTPQQYGDLIKTKKEGNELMLNYLTPHGKWHIHSTYGDTLRMLTLSRGIEPVWINDKDAASVGIKDNDWVEVHNDNGVMCTRACVSARIQPGTCIIYHSPERTYTQPKSVIRGMRRGGGHNSLTRVRLKPLLLCGGYGQFTYHFNYWGPTGINRDTHVLIRKMDRVEF